MHRGYFALWRKFEDHPFWKEKRTFSKAEAWLDILWNAQHDMTPQQVVLGMNVITCHYGETLKSLETWSKRWGWNKSRVRRFLTLLEKMEQIETKNETKTTRITVLNYCQYDPKRNDKETQAKRKRHGGETQATPDNNGKNVKNDNKRNRTKFDPYTLKPKEIDEKLWSEFLDNRKFKKLQNSKTALTRILNSFKEGRDFGYTYEQMIGRYIESGMQRFKVEWMADNGKQNDKKNKNHLDQYALELLYDSEN